MKSKVIFYCVLVFCSELVASVPYAADLQRYSGSFPNIPSMERSIQGNVPRPYQSVNQFSHDGLYNPPNLQYQELPRVNRDSYFAQSPRESFSSIPVRDISSGRYTNQQSIPSGFPENYADTSAQKEWQNIHLQIQNRPIESFPEVQHQNNRFINERPSPSAVKRYNIGESVLIGSLLNENRKLEQLVNQAASIPRESINLSNAPVLHGLSEPFYPQIPSIPVENSYRKSEQFIPPINEHFLQPAISKEEYSASVISQNKPEYNIPLQPIERLQARAGNPVEYVPEPVKPVTPKKHYFQQLYKAHPHLQNVLATAPNTKRYLVVHPNGTVESVDSLESVAQRNPNYVLVKAEDVAQKFPSGTEQPEISVTESQKPISEVIFKPTIAPVPVPTEILVDEKSGVVDTPIVNNTQQNFSLPILAPVTPFQITTTQPPIAVPKVIISHTVKQETIDSSTENISSTEIVPSSKSTTDKSVVTTKKNKEVLNTDSEQIDKTENLENSTVVITKTPTPVTSYTVQPSTSTASSVTQTIESTTAPPTIQQKNDDVPVVPVSQNQTSISTSTTIAPETYNQVNDTSTVSPNQNTSVTASTPIGTTTPISTISVIKNITTFETVDKNEQSVATSGSHIPDNPFSTSTPDQKDSDKNIPTAPNLGSLDFSTLKAKNKPAVWFRTSDPNFWNKLTEGNETFDVIYFFQIQNQPKIERDITKIIHPNGTIVEEMTETVWDNDSEEPTVRKTSKTINPEEA